MKIAVCGGHLTPALAIIEYLQTHSSEDEVVFIGRQYSQDNLKQISHEARETAERKVPFFALNAPRLNAGLNWQSLVFIPHFIWAVITSFYLLLQIKPHVFLSFGGYVALPLSIAAAILRIPIVTHEQTRATGFSNQFIARLAQKVAISYPQSQKYFSAAKTVVTGNPLRTALFKPAPKPTWVPKSAKPLLYITGGNQGSEILNMTTQHALRTLVANWLVIHQCGNPTLRRNYKTELEQSRKQLPATQQGNYVVKEWISEEELAWIYQHATMVVSRAGANTVSELIAHQLPAILIPLPFAHHDEQLLNAQYMSELGGAEIIHQKDLTPAKLLKTISTVKKYQKTLKINLAKIATNLDGAPKLFAVLKSVVK